MDIRLVRDLDLVDIYETEMHGNIVFLTGPRGLGKTHTGVYHMHKLYHDYEIDYEFCTNIQFTDEEGKRDMPDGVHFSSDYRSIWKNIAKIREKDYTKPILVSVDEMQEVVHRFKSTSHSSVIFDRWFRQFRKTNLTGLFITQDIYHSVPPNLLFQGDYILMKNNDLLDEFNGMIRKEKYRDELNDGQPFGVKFYKERNGKLDTNQRGKALTFVVDISRGIYKQVYSHENMITYDSVKNFKEHQITLHDVDGISKTQGCEWTDRTLSGKTFDTNASAVFGIYKLNDMWPKQWVKLFSKEIGRCDPADLSATIFSFFDKHEREDISLTPFEDLSNSRKAVVIYNVARLTDRQKLTQREAASIFGVSRSSFTQAERKWDQYLIDKHVEKMISGGDETSVTKKDLQRVKA